MIGIYTFGCGSDANNISITEVSEASEIILKEFENKYALDLADVPVVYNEDKLRFTSTVYYDQSLYRIYLYTDGRAFSKQVNPILPKGVQKVLLVVVNYPNLEFEEVLDGLWTEAQDNINDDHRSFADENELDDPLVEFESTNLLVEPGELDEQTLDETVRVAAENGHDPYEYDILMLVDLDTENPSGGFAIPFRRDIGFAKIGWFYDYDDTIPEELNEHTLNGIAFALYHHEVGHLWGWEHDWSNPYTERRLITDPELFGWTDLDNDGIPEIIDETPYGTD